MRVPVELMLRLKINLARLVWVLVRIPRLRFKDEPSSLSRV